MYRKTVLKHLPLVAVLLTACEPLPNVKVSGGNPPTFTLSGATDTLIFSVYSEDPHSHERQNLWELRNNLDPSVKPPVDVVYGSPPKGFRQTLPENAKAPLLLVEGRKYTYEAQGMYGARIGYFEMKEGNPVQLERDTK